MVEETGIAPWLRTDALFSLLDELRSARFQIDVRHYQRVQDLVLALGATGTGIADVVRLRDLMGPIVCHSAAEQRDFRRIFDAWAASIHPGREEAFRRTEVDAGSTVLADALRAVQRRSRRWRGLLGAAVLAVAVASAVWTWVGRSAEPAAGTPAPAPAPAGGAPVDDRPRWSGWVTFVGVLVIGAVGIWGALWYRAARQFLSRKATTTTPVLHTLSIQAAAARLYNPRTLARVAATCRLRSHEPGPELAIAETVNRTVRHGGLFSPVFRSRRVLPEYLALVERTSHSDQQAALIDHLLESLSRLGVWITRFHFDRDPRVCLPLRSRDEPLPLRHLAQRFGRHRLLVFSSTANFADPATGRLADWVAELAAWRERTILVPGADRSTALEEELRELFTVLPATLDGLSSLLSGLHADRPPRWPESGPAAPALPLAISADPHRWLDRSEPGEDNAHWLVSSLHAHLDPQAFTWVAACAVYPAMHWQLTVALGSALEARSPLPYVEPRRLAAVGQLPWFKHGHMPDWLRRRLVDALPPDAARTVRRTLNAMLLSALGGSTGDLALEIARRWPSTLDRFGRALQQVLRMRRDAPRELRDYVFVRFMAGRKARRLAVRLPEAVRRTLRGSAGERRVPDPAEDWEALGAAGTSQKGLLARSIGVVVAPRLTYAAIAAFPRVAGALVLLSGIMALANAAFFYSEVGQRVLLDQQVRQMEAAGTPVSDDTRAALGRSTRFFATVTVLTQPVFTYVFTLLISSFAFWVLRRSRPQVRFKHVNAVVAHSWFVLAITQCVVFTLDYLRESMISPGSLAALLPFLDGGTFVARFVGLIDLLTVWWLVNLSIGLGVLYVRRTRPIAIGALTLYLAALLALVTRATVALAR